MTAVVREELPTAIRRVILGSVAGAAVGIGLTLAYAFALSCGWVDEGGMAAVTAVVRVVACITAGFIASGGMAGRRPVRGGAAGLVCSALMTALFLLTAEESPILREMLIIGGTGLLAGLLAGLATEIVR